MPSQQIQMIEECCFIYQARQQADGSIEVVIKAEKRFAELWIEKLNNLMTTEDEIANYAPSDEK
jgi:hypothetical protein